MRKLLLATSFITCVIAAFASQMLIATGYAQTKPTCDGRSPQKEKCYGGSVPPGYYESGQCQGKMTGSVTCLKAIAFNIDDFGCTGQTLNNSTTPPSYTTYCVDGSNVECTHSRTCNGTIYNEYDMQGRPINVYTMCVQGATDPQISYRLKKTTLTSDQTNGCQLSIPLP